MKNLTMTLITICLCSMAVAQDISIGPRIGVNIASASNVEDSKSLTGVALGATGTYMLADNIGVTVDLLYSGEGFAQKGGPGKVKLGYFSIPLYFDYFFADPDAELVPKAYAGFVPEFLMSGKDEDDFDIKDTFNGVNFSISIGGGVAYKLSDVLSLLGDLRFLFGLSELPKDSGGSDPVKSTVIQLSAGVGYMIGS